MTTATATATVRDVKPPPARRSTPRSDRAAYLFLAPFLLVFTVFTFVPALMALAYSFTDIKAGDLRHPYSVDFVGLQTFATALGSPEFQRSVLNTGTFVVVGVPLTIAIGLALAVALNNGINRLKTFFRAALYAPVVTNVVAVAVIWQYAFTPSGPVNSLLSAAGINGPNWLGDPNWAMPTVIAMGIWRNAGTCMVLFLAGLQSLPTDVYEAAALDGAGAWRRFRLITLPMLRPTTLLVTVLVTVFYMNVFDEPFLLTKGGPLGSTETIALWVFQQFGFGNIGPSMAGSYVLLLLIAVVSFVQFRLFRTKE
ncbi:carbohydrate ABC transporter permease [Arthrobacter sp. S2(2024)]|uniref:carbohydrate ABC transporter permease n=1 Tax=Arthrobacter sp. S2(2024) TaxID=3111911 RepID=UPI002FCB9F6F